MAKKKAKKEYPTIKWFFDEFIDDKDARIFRFVVHGKINCKTEKRPMTMEIIIPTDICHGKIKEIDNWRFFGVAIPETKFKELPKKEVDSKNG